MDKKEQRKWKAYVQAFKDQSKVIKMLDNHDTEINLDGGTPLNHATNYNRNDIVEYLLERGANVNALQDGHYAPIMSAVEGENIALVSLLLKHEADVNLKDKHGNNALWKATFLDNIEIVELLLNNGANPFEEIRKGYSIYDGARDMKRTKIIEIFDAFK